MSAQHWQPLDVLNLENIEHGDVTRPNYAGVILLVRDWRDPAWLAVTMDTGQIVRVHDTVAHRYFYAGRAAGKDAASGFSFGRLTDLLARAVW